MIIPNTAQTAAAVAAHYDELDEFYRDIWGRHLHHGYWVTGRETPIQAAEALIALLAEKLHLAAGQAMCDIGCGYGATAQYLAEHYNVDISGFTISAAQAAQAQAIRAATGSVTIQQRDWLQNGLAAEIFDRAYAVESSEHMPDKQRFFDEAHRTLKPGGRLTICAWLAADQPTLWQVKHLLEPICREGRLPGMGTEADYLAMAAKSGFRAAGVHDISAQVSRTWWVCARRLVIRVVTQRRYRKFLLKPHQPNRVFALTLFRLLAAYRTKSMRYCLLTFSKV